jgi:hypothetical protein
MYLVNNVIWKEHCEDFHCGIQFPQSFSYYLVKDAWIAKSYQIQTIRYYNVSHRNSGTLFLHFLLPFPLFLISFNHYFYTSPSFRCFLLPPFFLQYTNHLALSTGLCTPFANQSYQLSQYNVQVPSPFPNSIVRSNTNPILGFALYKSVSSSTKCEQRSFYLHLKGITRQNLIKSLKTDAF